MQVGRLEAAKVHYKKADQKSKIREIIYLRITVHRFKLLD